MTDHQQPKNPNPFLEAEIHWPAFWALAVVAVGLALVIGLLLGPSFLNVSPFLFLLVCTGAWLVLQNRKRVQWRKGTKALSDFLWNLWSLIGVGLLFFFLVQFQAAAEEVATPAVKDLPSALRSLDPIWLGCVSAVVYVTACVRCFLALEDTIKEWRQKPTS